MSIGTDTTDVFREGNSRSFGIPTDAHQDELTDILTAVNDRAKDHGVEVSIGTINKVKDAYYRCSSMPGSGAPTDADRSLVKKHIGFFKAAEESAEATLRSAYGNSQIEFSFAERQELFQKASLSKELNGIVDGRISVSDDIESNSNKADTRFLRNLAAIQQAFAYIELGVLQVEVTELNEEVDRIKEEHRKAITEKDSEHSGRIQQLTDSHTQAIADAEKAKTDAITEKDEEHTAEKDRLQSQIDEGKTENDRLKAEIASKKAELETATEKLQEAIASGSSDAEKISGQAADLLRITGEKSAAESELESSKEALEAKKEELETLKSSHEAEVKSINDSHAEALAQKEQEHKDALSSERDRHTEALGTLTEEKDGQIKSLTERAEQAEAKAEELTEAQATISRLEGEKSDIQGRLTAAEEATGAEKEAKDKLQSELDAEKLTSSTLVSDKETLQGRLEAAEKATGAEREAKSAAEAESKRLDEELTAEKAKTSSYASLVGSPDQAQKLITSGGETNTALETARETIKELNLKIKSLEDENKALKQEVKDLKNDLRVSEEARKTAERERDAALAALERCQGTNTKLVEFQKVGGYIAATDSEISKLQGRIVSINQNARITADQKAAQVSTIHEEIGKLEHLKGQLSGEKGIKHLDKAARKIPGGEEAYMNFLPEGIKLAIEASATGYETVSRGSNQARLANGKNPMGK